MRTSLVKADPGFSFLEMPGPDVTATMLLGIVFYAIQPVSNAPVIEL